MLIGVPRETKRDEYRVAMLPVGVEELTRAGHQVLIESAAGVGSGIPDAEYAAEGAQIVASPADIYSRADLVVKVKEPLPLEYSLIRSGQTLFTYFHFAADRGLTVVRLRRAGEDEDLLLTLQVRAVRLEVLLADRGGVRFVGARNDPQHRFLLVVRASGNLRFRGKPFRRAKRGTAGGGPRSGAGAYRA